MTTPFPFQSAAVLTSAQMNAITTLPISTKTASYVALVGDVGSRLIMNVATANTLTINNSIFAEGDTIFIANKGAGTTTITAGAGVTINGTLTVAQHGGGTLVALSASVFTFFSGGGTGYGVATGGTSSAITVSGQAYTLLTFTASGTLTVTKSGLFDVLAISGGTSGDGVGGYGGGGGSGVVMQQTIYLTANQTITVGAAAGARANYTDPNIGNFSGVGTTSINSTLTGLASNVLDGSAQCVFESYGGNVGSGYGATRVSTATENYSGFRGGAGVLAAAGGGGGYSARGSAGVTTTGGAGGAGYDVGAFISGSTFKAAGGGGRGSVTGGAGGSSVGGAGGTTGVGTAAAANTASGGGGSQSGSAGGLGGSGIVYVRFQV